MENRRNYYRILQVQPDAPVEIIRASYRTLMQRLRAHPDLGGDHRTATLINEAYAVLTDAAKRAAYDLEHQEWVRDARGNTGLHAKASVKDAPADDRQCLFCHAPNAAYLKQHELAVCTRCGSPLHRATFTKLAADGKRAINRIPRDHPLLLYSTWPQRDPLPARCRDISPNGISFITAELPEPHAVLKLESEMCKAVVQIANLRSDEGDPEGPWLVGAGFLSVIFPRSRGAFLSVQA